jgi:hypothetical protein
MPNIPDDPKKVLQKFYEEYKKAKEANHRETFANAINVIGQLQEIGGVGNEENTFREILGVFMTAEQAAEEYRNILRDSKSYPNAS